MPDSKKRPGIAGLPAYDEESGNVNAVVEVVKGTRNKFLYHQPVGWRIF